MEGLFVNRIYLKIYKYYPEIIKVLLSLLVILFIIILMLLIQKVREVNELALQNEIILEEIEHAGSDDDLNNERRLEEFITRVEVLRKATGINNIEPVKFLSLIETILPVNVNLKALNYRAVKSEYHMRGLTNNSEDVSLFLERLEKNFGDVVLAGQKEHGKSIEFSVVVKVAQ